MEKKHNIVYLTSNDVTGKIYVGVHKTDNLFDGYIGSGKYLKMAIEKHGLGNFRRVVLFDFDNYDDAVEMERRIVTREFCRLPWVYNVTEGGNVCILHGEDNGFYGKSHSEEWTEKFKRNHPTKRPEVREKMSKGMKRYYAENGYPESLRETVRKASAQRLWTDESKRKLSESLKGRIFTPEHRQNISKSRVGKVLGPHTPEHRQRISESLKGVERPYVSVKINKNPEKIRKTAEKHRGLKRSEEAKKNISESKRMYVWVTPHGEFRSEKEFRESTGLSGGLLRNRCINNNDKPIRPSSLNHARDIPKEIKPSLIGKTWRELGWGRRPKDGLQ